MTRSLRLLAPLAAAALLAACASSSAPPRRLGPPPGQPPAPGPAYAPQPQPQPQAQAPFPWLLPGFGLRLPQPAASPGIFRPVNVQALVASIGRSPCAPAEVSPGNWVGFDCTPPTFVSRAVAFVRPHGFITGPLPEGVDHRQSGLEGPMKNQGAVGTCTAVSLSTAMEHALRRTSVTDPVSAMHVWSQYAVPQMGAAGDSNIDKRLSSDTTWPYDPAEACQMMRQGDDSCGAAYGVAPGTADSDPQIQAKKSAADSAGRHKLVGVERVSQHDPNVFAEILAGGDDLWVAFNVNMNNWRNAGHVDDHVIPDYGLSEATGHAVVLAGYRTNGGQKQFLIHNSWGTSWGDGGYAWIGENMIRGQLRYAYRVRVAGAGGGDTPPPPGQPPASGGCAQGQGIDVIYGQCAPLCANGAPAAAGLCPPPGMPGVPPSAPPASGKCAQGQAPDVLSGQCSALCPTGGAPIGGLCLPQVQ